MSYIVQETGSDPKIILLISHEDEETAMKKLGLQHKIAVGMYYTIIHVATQIVY